MKRTQAKAIERDLEKKMVRLSSPRQVGKSCLTVDHEGLSRDASPHADIDDAR